MKKAFLFLSMIVLIISCQDENVDPPIVESSFRPKTVFSNSIEGLDAKMEYFYEDDRIIQLDYYYNVGGELALYAKVDYQYYAGEIWAITSLKYGEEWMEYTKLIFEYKDGNIELISEYKNVNNAWRKEEARAYDYIDEHLKEAFYYNIDDGSLKPSKLNTYIYENGVLQKVNYSISPDTWSVFVHEVFQQTQTTWEFTMIRNSDSLIWEKNIYTIENNRFVHMDLFVRDLYDELELYGAEDYSYNSNGLLSEIISGIEGDTEQIIIEYEEGESNLEKLEDPELNAKQIPQSFLVFVDKSLKHFKRKSNK